VRTTRLGLRSRLAAAICSVALALAAAACGSANTPGQAGDSAVAPGQRMTTITDVLGRQVNVPLPAHRVLLGGQRLLYTTAILNKTDPTANVVGWPDDLLQNDPDTYQRYLARFPQIAKVPRIGQLPDGSVSVEQAIALHPDVFVVSAANFPAAKDAGIVDRLNAVGVPTVVVDFFVDPVHHTEPSVRLMGQLFGRTAEAERFVSYYHQAVAKVRTRLAAAHQPPTPVFLWRAPGYYDCCATFAESNLGQLITYAGGANMSDGLFPGAQGTLSPETVISRNPAVVIATGAAWAPGTPATPGGYVPLGYNENRAAAAAQLRTVVDKQAGFANLGAVASRRTYVVWHHFYDSPYNFLAVQWFAKWLHPDLFTDVDPDAEIQELHNNFLPIPAGGAFWAQLP
jgi:iron complex transport system substrate-binding protein